MQDTGSGLMGSVKRLATTLTSIVSTRLELLANELQEERLRLTQIFIFTLLALLSFGTGLLLLAVFIVVLFWDEHRLVALGALSAIFFALGLLSTVLQSKSRSKSRLFSASLAELAKDKDSLGPNHE